MKAAVCTKYGPPEVLEIRDIEKPFQKDKEVLIKIHATTVTSGDSRMRSFNVPLSFWLIGRLAMGIRRPKKEILGQVFAGEIEGVGRRVKSFNRGDKVFGVTGNNFGAYAEYICLPENGVIVSKPESITYEEAASIPFGGVTALHFLREAGVREGQKVLIDGASGDVGTWAVQLANYFGAEVTGVCSTENLDMVRSLGADHVIDYTAEDFTDNSEKYDVIFEAVGKRSVSSLIKPLNKGGVLLHLIAAPGTTIQMKWASITTDKKMIGGEAVPNAEDLDYLKKLVEKGEIKPVIDRSYPLDQIVDAHRYVDTGHKKGSVVITIGSDNIGVCEL